MYESGRSEVCGTCKWNRYDDELDAYYCGNRDSEYNDETTRFTDECEEWEGI